MISSRKMNVKKIPQVTIMTFLFLCLHVFFLFAGSPVSVYSATTKEAEGGVSAKALLEKDSVSLGEPFIMQIRVEGVEISPGVAPPDMSAVSDFTVEPLGGQSNNSSSITIINGAVSKVESFGYTYSYRLTSKKKGRLAIPSIEVPVDATRSKTLRTAALTVTVTEPETSDDFHLELKFSKTELYVGEPAVLTVIWRIARDVEEVSFNLPILQEQAFTFSDPQIERDPGKQYFQLSTGGTNIIAEKGTEVFNGRQYTTLSFQKILFAKTPGRFETPEATVSCKTLMGYSRQQRKRSPFDGFFDDDFFNPGRRGVYKTFVTRSEPVVLTALELPDEGKPAGFAGWVGRFHIESSATPTEVSIGDPLTLTVSVSGPEHLDNIALPSLADDPEIEENFKIPDEMAAGVIRGSTKEFTQTLRPKSSEIEAIPSIKIPYFNPDSGRYEVAESKPIPLIVKQTKILTSADVEGASPGTEVRKSELENWSRGIAHNYEGPQILARETYRISSIVRSPRWIALTFISFIAFLILLAFVKIRQRQTADPERWRSRKAFTLFEQRVQALRKKDVEGGDSCALLLDALRSFLGDKLGCNGAALTFSDAKAKLEAKEVDVQIVERLRSLFEACEQGSYGGMATEKPQDELAKEAVEAIRSLDRAI